MAAVLLTCLVARVHAGTVVLELALWTRPAGRKVFGSSEAFADESRRLAANQGICNGFWVAGLVWGLWLGPAGDPIKVFSSAAWQWPGSSALPR